MTLRCGVESGETVNIPANAPHSFRNAADVPARLLCTAVPAGLEAFFAEFGDRVASRPRRRAHDEEQQAAPDAPSSALADYGMRSCCSTACRSKLVTSIKAKSRRAGGVEDGGESGMTKVYLLQIRSSATLARQMLQIRST